MGYYFAAADCVQAKIAAAQDQIHHTENRHLACLPWMAAAAAEAGNPSFHPCRSCYSSLAVAAEGGFHTAAAADQDILLAAEEEEELHTDRHLPWEAEECSSLGALERVAGP